MLELERFFLYDKILRLHRKKDYTLNWYTLNAKTLGISKYDPLILGKALRNELIKRNILTRPFQGKELITTLTEIGQSLEGFLIKSSSDQDSEYPKVLRSYSRVFNQNFMNPDYEQIVHNRTEESSFFANQSGKEIKSFHNKAEEIFEKPPHVLTEDQTILDRCFDYLLTNHAPIGTSELLRRLDIHLPPQKIKYFEAKITNSGLISKHPGYGNDDQRFELNGAGLIALTELGSYSKYDQSTPFSSTNKSNQNESKINIQGSVGALYTDSFNNNHGTVNNTTKQSDSKTKKPVRWHNSVLFKFLIWPILVGIIVWLITLLK